MRENERLDGLVEKHQKGTAGRDHWQRKPLVGSLTAAGGRRVRSVRATGRRAHVSKPRFANGALRTNPHAKTSSWRWASCVAACLARTNGAAWSASTRIG